METKTMLKTWGMILFPFFILLSLSWLYSEAEEMAGPIPLTSAAWCKEDAREHGYTFVRQEYAGGGLFSSPDNNCWVKNAEGEVFQLW